MSYPSQRAAAGLFRRICSQRTLSDGSPRSAAATWSAVRGEPSDERASVLAGSGLVRAVSAEDPTALAEQVTAALRRSGTS